jgi:hypothetical protein
MIDLGKKYRTRDGREVELYAIKPSNGKYPVFGAVQLSDGWWDLRCWMLDGTFLGGEENDQDLIGVKQTHRRTVEVYVNIYADGARVHNDKRQANFFQGEGRLACKHITLEIEAEEGEGL